MNHNTRLIKVEQQLETSHLDAIFITHLANIHYLCGFTGSSGVLAFARGTWAFFSDGRYTEQARLQVKAARVFVEKVPPLSAAARWLAQHFKQSKTVARIGFESDHLTVALEDRIRREMQDSIPKSKFRLIPTTEFVERFRIVKDREEIGQIRKAVKLASNIFPRLLQAIRPGESENVVAAELEHLARHAGAEKMSFETIVAAGRRSAMPHARPTLSKIGKGFVVLDYGVILGGYCSDMTRTIFMGDANKAERELYSAVLEAQLAGISAVRAGVQAQDVDAAARTVLKGYKLEKYFTHSLGHGVGIEIHEAPRLARGQTLTLEPGMMITIEPGAYIPNRYGVRIEDMVLVTRSGCEVLTPTPKELVIC